MTEPLLIALVVFFLWRGPPWLTPVRTSPENFAAMLQAMPRSTLVVEEVAEWSGLHTYTFRDASHVIVAESEVALELPANVVRAVGSQFWWARWPVA